MSKIFYLQTAQAILSLCCHKKTHLSRSLNLTCFMDLLLESYKYDKTKVRIVIINSQKVHQIFKIQQYCCTVMALGPVLRLNIKWKHLESKNANFQNNFWMISIVFNFMNLRHELYKIFCNYNKQKIKPKQFWDYAY